MNLDPMDMWMDHMESVEEMESFCAEPLDQVLENLRSKLRGENCMYGPTGERCTEWIMAKLDEGKCMEETRQRRLCKQAQDKRGILEREPRRRKVWN